MRKLALLSFLLCATFALAQNDNPLKRPVWELGPWAGGGTGLGEGSAFKFVSAGVRVGRVLTGEIGSGRFRGTFEWAADIMPVYAVRQADFYTSGPERWIYGGAINPIVLKWNFTGGRRIVPYIAAEGGLLLTSRDVPAADTSSVNFLPGGAFGVYVLRGKRQALDFSVHLTHISNASLADKNPGINATMQFRIGYTWFK
jgi:lipid A 3-O-deacylase